jgi:hypothetical protein
MLHALVLLVERFTKGATICLGLRDPRLRTEALPSGSVKLLFVLKIKTGKRNAEKRERALEVENAPKRACANDLGDASATNLRSFSRKALSEMPCHHDAGTFRPNRVSQRKSDDLNPQNPELLWYLGKHFVGNLLPACTCYCCALQHAASASTSTHPMSAPADTWHLTWRQLIKKNKKKHAVDDCKSPAVHFLSAILWLGAASAWKLVRSAARSLCWHSSTAAAYINLLMWWQLLLTYSRAHARGSGCGQRSAPAISKMCVSLRLPPVETT